MRVFEKNSADPCRDREEKHVVTESRRPIRHGEADAFARHHPAAANEQERGRRGKTGKAMEVAIGFGGRRAHWAQSGVMPVRLSIRRPGWLLSVGPETGRSQVTGQPMPVACLGCRKVRPFP